MTTRRAQQKTRVARKRVVRTKRPSARRNPAPRANHHMQGAVYMGVVKSIVYNNAGSAHPSRSYIHKFGPGAKVYALRDGSIAIKSAKRLTGKFIVGSDE